MSKTKQINMINYRNNRPNRPKRKKGEIVALGLMYEGRQTTSQRVGFALKAIQACCSFKGIECHLSIPRIESNIVVGCITCDRIDPNDYTDDNTLPMCPKCNYMRHTAKIQEWWDLIKTIYLNYCTKVEDANGDFHAALKKEHQYWLSKIIDPASVPNEQFAQVFTTTSVQEPEEPPQDIEEELLKMIEAEAMEFNAVATAKEYGIIK